MLRSLQEAQASCEIDEKEAGEVESAGLLIISSPLHPEKDCFSRDRFFWEWLCCGEDSDFLDTHLQSVICRFLLPFFVTILSRANQTPGSCHCHRHQEWLSKGTGWGCNLLRKGKPEIPSFGIIKNRPKHFCRLRALDFYKKLWETMTVIMMVCCDFVLQMLKYLLKWRQAKIPDSLRWLWVEGDAQMFSFWWLIYTFFILLRIPY